MEKKGTILTHNTLVASLHWLDENLSQCHDRTDASDRPAVHTRKQLPEYLHEVGMLLNEVDERYCVEPKDTDT